MDRTQIINEYRLRSIDTELLASLTQTIKASLNADIAGVALYGNEEVYILSRALNKELKNYDVVSFGIKESIGINAINIQRPLYVTDTRKDKRTNHSQQVNDVFKIRSVATYPIVHLDSGVMIATISCLYTKEKQLTNDEKIIFQTFGKSATQIFNDSARRIPLAVTPSFQSHKIEEYNNDLIESHRYGFDETAYKRAIKYMSSLTGATTGILLSRDGDGDGFKAHSAVIDKEITSLDQTIENTSRFIDGINDHETVLLNVLDEAYRQELKQTFAMIDIEFENCLGIPLLVRNELVGFIALFNAERGFVKASLNAYKGLVGAISSLVINDRMQHLNTHYKQKIEDALKQDELTSIPNMAGGVDYLEKLVNQGDKLFTLCMIDLDKFSYLNTIYNRSEGDVALITITNRINQHIRKQDFFSRVGGDMLMIIFEGHQEENRIQDILDLISKPIHIQEESVSIRASAAYMHGPAPDISGERHFSFLINPLYKAKQFERIEYADASDEVIKNDEIKFLQDFNYAVRENQIALYGLPAFNVLSNEVACIEILSRWHHPIKGVLSPQYFLPSLNKDRASLALFDYAIIMKSVYFMLGLYRKNVPYPTICINVSPALLTSNEAEDLLYYFEHDLHEDIVKKLCFELIEWDTHEDEALLLNRIKRFKSLGVSIALDDFGTGNSNIDRLITFPIDIVKIDQSFLLNIENNKKNKLAVQSMIDIAKRLNKTVIVEGIESKSDVEYLQKMGGDYLQGYYFQKPTPLELLLGRSNV